MSVQEHGIEPNRTNHVLMFAMLRWFAKHDTEEYLPLPADIVILGALRDHESPLQEYPRQRITTHARKLKQKGLLEKVTYYDQTLGWRLTEEGLDVLEELGRPKQYDH